MSLQYVSKSKNSYPSQKEKNNEKILKEKLNEILDAEAQLALAFSRIPGGGKMVQGIIDNLDGETLLQAFSAGVCFVNFIVHFVHVHLIYVFIHTHARAHVRKKNVENFTIN